MSAFGRVPRACLIDLATGTSTSSSSIPGSSAQNLKNFTSSTSRYISEHIPKHGRNGSRVLFSTTPSVVTGQGQTHMWHTIKGNFPIGTNLNSVKNLSHAQNLRFLSTATNDSLPPASSRGNFSVLLRKFYGVVAGLAAYGLVSTALTPQEFVEKYRTPGSFGDWFGLGMANGFKAIARDFVWFTAGAVCYSAAGGSATFHAAAAGAAAGGSGAGGLGAPPNIGWSLRRIQTQASALLRKVQKVNDWKSYRRFLRQNNLSMANMVSLAKLNRQTYLEFALVLGIIQFGVNFADYMRAKQVDAFTLYKAHVAELKETVKPDVAVIELSYEQFHELTSAIVKKDLPRIAALFPIKSDIDSILLLHTFRDLDVLHDSFRWKKGGCLRELTMKEIYNEIEEMNARLIDQLDAGYMVHSFLPLLYDGKPNERRILKETRQGLVDILYPALRHAYSFNPGESNYMRMNPWVCWLPLTLGIKGFMANPFVYLEAFWALSVVTAVTDQLVAWSTVKGWLKYGTKGWLHVANALVLSYSGYHMYPYLVELQGGTDGKDTHYSEQYTERNVMKVTASGGVLWRSRPLWLSTCADSDYPKWGDEIEVFTVPGQVFSSAAGDISKKNIADSSGSSATTNAEVISDGPSNSSSKIVEWVMVKRSGKELFLPVRSFSGETDSYQYLLEPITGRARGF